MMAPSVMLAAPVYRAPALPGHQPSSLQLRLFPAAAQPPYAVPLLGARAAVLPLAPPTDPSQFVMRVSVAPATTLGCWALQGLSAPLAGAPAGSQVQVPLKTAEVISQVPVQLPPELPQALKDINFHYGELMMLLRRQGFFDGLRLSAGGELCINVPFCGSFLEAPALAAFVERELLPANPLVSRVRIIAADVEVAGADSMVARPHDARIHFRVQRMDLSAHTLPPAAVTIGLHPQPLPPSALWERLIANVLRSSNRCVFTCWMRAEADELLRICRAHPRYSCTIQRNPTPMQGEGASGTGAEASLRFQWIVLVKQLI